MGNRSRGPDAQLPANDANQRLRNLPMTRDGRPASAGDVQDDTMASALAEQDAAFGMQMTQQVAPFHGVPAVT